MVEWKVEDYKLMNDPGVTVNDDGKKIFSIETMLPREEKYDYLNKKYDGALDYIYHLADQYKIDYPSLKKDNLGMVKQVSAKAWKRKHDPKNMLYGCPTEMLSSCENYIFGGRLLKDLNIKGNFDVHEDYVSECFNRELRMLEEKERDHRASHMKIQ